MEAQKPLFIHDVSDTEGERISTLPTRDWNKLRWVRNVAEICAQAYNQLSEVKSLFSAKVSEFNMKKII